MLFIIFQAQFQQKQMQEKEQKLLQMLDAQQQKALQKAALNGVIPPGKYSNGIRNNINNGFHNNSSNNNSATSAHSNHSTSTIIGTGKVKKNFLFLTEIISWKHPLVWNFWDLLN